MVIVYFCIIFVILLILAHISLRIRELEACLASHCVPLLYVCIFQYSKIFPSYILLFYQCDYLHWSEHSYSSFGSCPLSLNIEVAFMGKQQNTSRSFMGKPLQKDENNSIWCLQAENPLLLC